jgi:replicative DNA helicase
MRLLSMEAGIDQHRLRLGRVEDHEWEHIVAAMGTLSEERLWIDDTAGLSLSSLRSRARRPDSPSKASCHLVRLFASCCKGTRDEVRGV